MLSNNLTLDEEDAVQAELKELEAVSRVLVAKHRLFNRHFRIRCTNSRQSRISSFLLPPQQSLYQYQMVVCFLVLPYNIVSISPQVKNGIRKNVNHKKSGIAFLLQYNIQSFADPGQLLDITGTISSCNQ
jgi:hypothetical protein